MNKIKLSQCMIVKNEEKNIRKALSWAKNIAHEQIVVDTGSTDNTINIATEMGAKVYHFSWINDFSAAKNFAIEQAKGDWIAFLDADEYLSDADAIKLLPYIEEIEKNEIIYRKKYQNIPTIIRCSWVHLDDKGEPFSINVQDRIFKNVSYIRYKNKIHEALTSLDEHELMVVEAKEEFKIFHTGYQNGKIEDTDKGKRNIRMLQETLKEKPDDLNLLFYLVDALFIEKEYKQAEEVCQKAVSHKDKGISGEALTGVYQKWLQILNLINNKNTDEKMMRVYNEAIALDSGHPDFDLFIGYRMAASASWSKAVYYLENALKKVETYSSRTNIIIYGELSNVYRCLYIANNNLHDTAKLIKYGTLSLYANKYQEDLLTDIIIKFTYEYPTPGNEIYAFLMKIYDFKNKKDSLFTLKCTKLAGNRELDSMISSILSTQE